MKAAYGLNFASQQQMQPEFMYPAAAHGDVDVISAFSSDGLIAKYDLVVLEERLTRTCNGIREGAVIAAPDADGVAAIAFYYTPRPEVEACAAACLTRFAEGLPLYQRPRWIRELPALPRTPTGKLLRRVLKAELSPNS